jgi:predicted GNAT family acetyltransferase
MGMEIGHDEQKKKGLFFVEENGERSAKLEYFYSAPGAITVYHTEVDEKLRGQSIGDKLVAAAVGYARESGLKIVPTCPFAKKVFDRTREFQDVLA